MNFYGFRNYLMLNQLRWVGVCTDESGSLPVIKSEFTPRKVQVYSGQNRDGLVNVHLCKIILPNFLMADPGEGRLGQGQLGQLERDIREDAPLSWFVLKRFFAPKRQNQGFANVTGIVYLTLTGRPN